MSKFACKLISTEPVKPDYAWLTHVTPAQEPRQALSNLRAKNAVRIEQVYTVWSREPMAERVTLAACEAFFTV